jgi:hypothetical protein
VRAWRSNSADKHYAHHPEFAGWIAGGQWSLAIAVILMVISLGISLRELQVSGGALDLLLRDMEQHEKLG